MYIYIYVWGQYIKMIEIELLIFFLILGAQE
jgi:hypothetical protein